MNEVLIYYRNSPEELSAEKSAEILSQQLQLVGFNTYTSHQLNIPRLILNSYQTVHFVVESLPLTLNEALHLAICKALNKSTLLSVLNSHKKENRSFYNYIKPDAFSVSQTNHLKNFRHLSSHKFILSPLHEVEGSSQKKTYEHSAYLIPLQAGLTETVQFNLTGTVYFDGRKLLKKYNSSLLRKKWNELISEKKVSTDHHLILSDNKILQILSEGSLKVILADPNILPTDLALWLKLAMNKNNLLVLNEFQATGFSSYWTSGQNCYVLSAQKWIQELSHLDLNKKILCSNAKEAELFEPIVNDLSRLYSKLWHQKTSLLTSKSAKL